MTGKRRSVLSQAGRRRPPLAVLVAAMLAVFLQAFVVQTHTHVQPPLGSIGYESPADHLQDGHTHVSATDEQGGCIVCQVFAASGQTIAPSTSTLSEARNAAYEIAVQAIRRAPRALTHVWQSRAPPIAL